VSDSEPDTGERIRRVYRYVDKEIERTERNLAGQMASGFARVERALAQVTNDVGKTREEVAVVRTKVEGVESSRQQEPLKDILATLQKEKKSMAPPAAMSTKRMILFTSGGVVGGGGLIAGILKFLEWLQATL